MNELLTALSSTAVSLLIFGFVAKSWFDYLFKLAAKERDDAFTLKVKNIEDELQRRATEYETQLQSIASAIQTKFTHLHAKRVQYFEDFGAALAEFMDMAFRFYNNPPPNEEEFKAASAVNLEKYYTVWRIFSSRKFFVSTDLGTKMFNTLNSVRQFALASEFIEDKRLRRRFIDEALEKLKEAQDALENDVREILRADFKLKL